jgi:hypothetical protein
VADVEVAAVEAGVEARTSVGGGGSVRERDASEAVLGENEASGLGPLRARGGCGDGGVVSRGSPTLPSCEARIELLSRARLRGSFQLNWALPALPDRANKQRNL